MKYSLLLVALIFLVITSCDYDSAYLLNLMDDMEVMGEVLTAVVSDTLDVRSVNVKLQAQRRGEDYRTRERDIYAPNTVIAGEEFAISYIGVDSLGLDLQVRFNWGNGSITTYSDLAPSGSLFESFYSYRVEGTYVITPVLRNSDGIQTIDIVNSHTIIVTEAPAMPGIVGEINAPAFVRTGENFTVSVRAYDPDNNSVQVKFNWGNGMVSTYSQFAPSNSIFSRDYTYHTSGTYHITVSVRNSNGFTMVADNAVFTITVDSAENFPFVSGNISSPIVVTAGQLFPISVTAGDPNNLEVQVRFIWGDGTISLYSDLAASGTDFYKEFAYRNPGMYTINVTVRNSDGLVNNFSQTNHNIIVMESQPESLITGVLVHNNNIYLSAREPVNFRFKYSSSTYPQKEFQGFSADSKRTTVVAPLVVSQGNLPYDITLTAKSNNTTQDTTFTFLSTHNTYDSFLRVDFVDVRQGDGIFIKTPEGHHLIIDGGYGARIPSFTQGAYWNGNAEPFMLNYVLENGVNHISHLVETHNHMDHWGGLADIIGYGMNYDYHFTTNNHLDYEVGDFLNINSQVSFEIINLDYPPGLDLTGDNDRSIVLKASYGEISYLFTGDIESSVENYIVQNNFNISADVLKIAHHGSNSSSQAHFLEAVLNKYAKVSVMSFGTGNPYNHPRNLHRFANSEVFGNGLPTHEWEGDNYHFDVGTTKTYTDGYVLILEY